MSVVVKPPGFIWQPPANDCLARRKEGEPYFVLLARDPLAEGIVRIWAALRAQKPELAADIFKNLQVTSKALPYSPDKQTSHVVEAREVANHMNIWLTDKLQNGGAGTDAAA